MCGSFYKTQCAKGRYTSTLSTDYRKGVSVKSPRMRSKPKKCRTFKDGVEFFNEQKAVVQGDFTNGISVCTLTILP